MALPLTVSAAFGDGLRKTLRGSQEVGSGFGRGLGRIREDVSRGSGILGGDLTRGVGLLGDGLLRGGSLLSGGLLRGGGILSGNLAGGLSDLGGRLSGQFLFETEGATSFETAIEHQGLGRRVLYIQPEITASASAPAVVFLHFGRTGTAERMANLTRAARLASEFGVWVILPEAVNKNWNENPNALAANDDSGFIAKVIEQASADYPIDAKRIYLAGMSNGGFMATRFVCEHPGRVAGVAIVAATMRVQQDLRCPQDEPVPFLIIAGTSDPIVPYNGRIGLRSARETFVRWADNNECNASDETEYQYEVPDDDRTIVRVNEVSSCANASAVRLVTVERGGHAWPGSEPLFSLSSFGRITANPDATLELWSFLQAFSLQ